MVVHHNIPLHTIVVHHIIIAGSVGYWSVLAPPVYYLVNHFPPVYLPLLHTLHATPTTPQLLFIITHIPKRQLVHPSLHHSTPSHLFLWKHSCHDWIICMSCYGLNHRTLFPWNSIKCGCKNAVKNVILRSSENSRGFYHPPLISSVQITKSICLNYSMYLFT